MSSFPEVTEPNPVKENFPRLWDSAPEAMLVIRQDGGMVLVNAQTEKLFGYGRRELLGKPVEILVPERFPRQHWKSWARLLAEPRMRPMSIARELYGRRKDGSEFPVEISLSSLASGEGPLLFVVAIRDISDRKAAEDALRTSEAHYRDFVENANDILYTHDLEGKFTSFNRAAELVFGYKREEALGMNVRQVLAPEYQELARQMLERKLAGESRTTYVVEIVAKNGRRVELEVNTRLVYQGAKPVGVQVIARDLSERKQLEEQLRLSQKMEAVGRLAGGIAHDFNNLLTVIQGYGELLVEELPAASERHRRAAGEIYHAAERASALTRQLLAFSRRQVLEPKVLDLNDVVAGLEKMLRRLIGEHIEMHTAGKPGLGRVKADPGQIEQVIVNLVVNARDAMPNGGKLTIETANVELDETYVRHHLVVQPGLYVMLAVSDTGCGMDAETQRRIFEPFFTTKEKGKGTGLGLSTVYGIVKQSGGYIWVYSEVGQGTTFKIYLPRVEEAAEKEPVEQPKPMAAHGSETVLLVEDEAKLRALIHQTLEGHGYRLMEAKDVADALRIAEQHQEPIHLLLTDVVMPKMSGRALAGLLTQLHPETRVLYISGYTEDAIVHHGVLDKGVAFLQKPFTAADLSRKIREVLESKP